MKIGSLFSGYGGLDRAVQSVFPQSQTAWHCEFDKAPSAILAHHYPNVPNLHDVTQVDWEQVEPVDIITGGSPCQDLSTAGKRAGMTEGTRSNLWVNMREAIAIIKPRLVVWENVQGALSAAAYSSSDMEPGQGLLGGGDGHLRALGRVLGDLAALGYDARWTTIRASDIGAPHHRARVFLIAYPADTGCVGLQAARWGGGYGAQVAGPVGGAGTLPELEYLPTLKASDAITGDNPSNARRDMPGITVVSHHFPHLPTPQARDGLGGGQHPDIRESGGHSVTMRDIGIELGGLAHLPTPNMMDHLPARDGGVYGRYEPVVRRWETVTGTTAPNPTELNRNGKPRLNVEFASWMMGLPKGWITGVPGLSRANQLKAIGNGVVPQQAAAALESMLT